MANGHDADSAGGGNPDDATRAASGDPQLLASAGRALYGQQHWRMSLAELLQVNRRSLQRWLNGQNEIPDGVWFMLRGALAARISEQKLCLELIRARQHATSTTKEA